MDLNLVCVFEKQRGGDLSRCPGWFIKWAGGKCPYVGAGIPGDNSCKLDESAVEGKLVWQEATGLCLQIQSFLYCQEPNQLLYCDRFISLCSGSVPYVSQS